MRFAAQGDPFRTLALSMRLIVINLIRFAAFSGTLAGLVLLSPSAFGQGNTPNIQILVHGVHFGGKVVYRYQVRNSSTATINRVSLGVDDVGKDLPGIPWSQDASLTEVASEVPAAQCRPFAGMRCSVAVYQFDYMPEPRAVVSMRGLEASQSPPPSVLSGSELIRPGTISSTAEIYVPVRASGYLSGSGTVGFLDNLPRDSEGKPIVTAEIPFTRIDTTPPPSIAGNADIARRGGMLDVRVTLSVADNLDSAPQVVLESVSANEPLRANDVRAQVGSDARLLQLKRNRGRIYYLTYRAIDGSDNSASVVITVPGEL